MTAKQTEQPEPMQDRNAFLENAFIKEYLHEKGYSLKDLKKLSAELAGELMKEAQKYASLKLAEVEARAHFVEEIHDNTSSHE